MTRRRLHFLLRGVCTEGSHARNASLLLSFIGCRRVASILPSTCIDNSWPLDHGFRKDKKNFTKGKVVEHEAPPMMTGAQILDQLNSQEPDPNRPGYFLGYNTEHAWTHKPCFWDLPYFKDL